MSLAKLKPSLPIEELAEWIFNNYNITDVATLQLLINIKLPSDFKD